MPGAWALLARAALASGRTEMADRFRRAEWTRAVRTSCGQPADLSSIVADRLTATAEVGERVRPPGVRSGQPPASSRGVITRTVEGRRDAFGVHAVDYVAGGTLWHDRLHTVVRDARGRLVEAHSVGSPDAVALATRHSVPCPVDGRLILLGERGAANYFHWLLDVVPKLELLAMTGDRVRTVDRVVLATPPPRFAIETLAHYGIASAQTLVTTDGALWWCASELVLPRWRSAMATRAGPWLPETLRARFVGARASAHAADRRLYVARSANGAAGRLIGNEAALWSRLETHGFERVLPERLSVTEQAATFDRAAVVVAPHGAGLANLVFCRPGTTVIELYGAHRPPCYESIATAGGLDYIGLDCRDANVREANDWTTLDRRRGEGFDVDLDRVERHLAIACAAGDRRTA